MMIEKAYLFDFDGTIANTVKCITATMYETFRQLGFAPEQIPSYDAMVATIGLPLLGALKELGNFDDKKAQEATDLYRIIFKTFEKETIEIFPQVAETLACLSKAGMRMGIVTSRNYPSLERILKYHGLFQYFEAFMTNNESIAPKPAPDMALALLQKMNLKPEEAMVIGDTTFDILMGNRAGCQTVAVTYGNHSREMLMTASPTFIIDSFSELLQIL